MIIGQALAASESVIAFVRSPQPRIDRGWDPVDVTRYLVGLGLSVIDVTVSDIADARRALRRMPGSPLVWPVCYTIGSREDGPLLVDLLTELRIRYVGAGARSQRFSSKIALKQALGEGPIATPNFCLVTETSVDALPFAPPYVLKCEYSCNSEGILVVRNRTDTRRLWYELRRKYGQRVFAEEWARQREFTIAYVPVAGGSWIAPMEMVVTSGADYVDVQAKQRNADLLFKPTDNGTTKRLTRLTTELVAHLSLDGHFRVDVLADDHGTLQVVDLNFLPQLHLYGPEQSYFLIAISEALGISPTAVVDALLEYSRAR